MARHEIALQPKQCELLDLIERSRAVVIGVGGGRGAAKSSGADRVAITLMYQRRGLACCMVMRTWVKQIVPYHLEPIRRDFPWLSGDLKISAPATLRIGDSRMEFKFAENYDAVVESFRSGNYGLVFVDQAEQFTEREIREIRKAVRAIGDHPAKIVLLFNMRGSGIQWLRKWFYSREYGKDEDPEDYAFLKVNPWDNVEWVRPALAQDGYTEKEYYAWTDSQRRDYAAKRGVYTKLLATDDEAIRAADWYGGWDSVEGAYFASVFDLEASRVTRSAVADLMKPWASLWMSQDWGKAHWCVTYWHFRVTLSPAEVERFLGWRRVLPVNVICTYRELIISEMTSSEVGRKMVDSTPPSERERIKAVFLSPEACGTEAHDSANTVASQEAKELRPYNMPGPSRADNDRIGGWSLMAKLLKAAKERGVSPDGVEHNDVWLISSECPELLNSIPMAMRDDKNLDDVLKTDKSQAKLEQDVLDAVRYGIKSMLAPRKKSAEDIYRESVAAAADPQKLMMMLKHEQRHSARAKRSLPPSWKGRL